MKVLVTGATGLLGESVVRELQKAGYETRCLVHATAIKKNSAISKSEIVWGDITKEEEIPDYLKGCDGVVHCAWSFVKDDDIEKYSKLNILPTIELLKQASNQGIKKFITISSVSVYGLESISSGKPFDEDDEFCSYDDAMDIYPRAKQQCERDLIDASKELDLDLVIIRPGLLYSDSVAPVKKSIKSKVGLFAGMGNNHLPYIHVDSVSELIMKVLEDKNLNKVEVFNAVPSHNDTARAVFLRWKKRTGSNAKPVYLPVPFFKALAMAPYFIKKALKKEAVMPNVEYQTKTGTRNVGYSSSKAEKKYNWFGY